MSKVISQYEAVDSDPPLSVYDEDSDEGFRNPPMLSAILQDSPGSKAANIQKCTLCHQVFDSKRRLKMHEKKCRREDSQRVMICGA